MAWVPEVKKQRVPACSAFYVLQLPVFTYLILVLIAYIEVLYVELSGLSNPSDLLSRTCYSPSSSGPYFNFLALRDRGRITWWWRLPFLSCRKPLLILLRAPSLVQRLFVRAKSLLMSKLNSLFNIRRTSKLTNLSVVFVHGLMGHRINTWTYHSKKAESKQRGLFKLILSKLAGETHCRSPKVSFGPQTYCQVSYLKQGS